MTETGKTRDAAAQLYQEVTKTTVATVLNEHAWYEVMATLDRSAAAARSAGLWRRAGQLDALMATVRAQSAQCLGDLGEDAEHSWNPEALAATVRRIADRGLIWVNYLNRVAHAAHAANRAAREAEAPAAIVETQYAAEKATRRAKKAQADALHRGGC